MKTCRLLVEVAEGRVAAAILGNGFLMHCNRLGAETVVLTPGAVYPPFLGRYKTDGASFLPISADTPVDGRGRLVVWEQSAGRWLACRRLPRLRRWLWEHVGARLAARSIGGAGDTLGGTHFDGLLATDVRMGFGRGLVGACQRRGIPTLGNMFSWDHPYYDPPSRPDHLTCWSPMGKAELVRRCGFEPERIEVIGAPAFDGYLSPGSVWTRAELCNRLGLDPNRPIVLFATLGQMKKLWDETGPFRALLEEIDAGRIPGRPQVVLRLHPLSNNNYFFELSQHPGVVTSRYTGYSPGMRWWPSQEEVAMAGNLMRHADVCLSPGSTMAIEPSIFDTPTVVPVFNQYMPEEHERFFNTFWMSRHFRFLAERNLLPFPRSVSEMRDAVCRAPADRTWMQAERRVIRDEVLGPLDGRATERLAAAAVRMATAGPNAAAKKARRAGGPGRS